MENKKTAVLITNLGTPKKATKKEVRLFLKEFLSDTRVIKLPKFLWWFVLHLVILPFRTPKTTSAYKKVWGEKNSPLLDISERQVALLKGKLPNHKIVLAMRYAQPSIKNALKQVKDFKKLIVLPLYPQYSGTTTATTFDAIANEFKTYESIPDFKFIRDYHNNNNYITALKNSVQEFWQKQKQANILLMSFHGLPQKYIDDGDTYYAECVKTSELLASALGLNDNQWQLTFQSRMGKTPWIKPYTSEVLSSLATQNKSVQVICPGFSVDCLETLEEIAIENKKIFLNAGGLSYQYIPCLNDSEEHIDFLAQLVLGNT
jgi:ferrochelatase